jgi:prevent-host-death family protein
MTKILPASEVKTHFYRLVDRFAIGDEIVVTKNGKPTVAILSAKELSALKETLDVLSDPELMRQIRSSEREARRGARRYTFKEVFGEPLVPPRRLKRRPR